MEKPAEWLQAAAPEAPQAIWSSPAERTEAVANLRNYFHANAPQLLRPAQGVLRFPSISPSLPH
jgi:hypothetical protein